jgi:hypothetical protein
MYSLGVNRNICIPISKTHPLLVSYTALAALLVLIIGWIYEVPRWDGIRQHDMHAKFYDDWFENYSSIKVITSKTQNLGTLLCKSVFQIDKFNSDSRIIFFETVNR